MTFAVLSSRYQYKVQKPLGSGGQGAVFRGQDLHTGAAVVIKILHDDQSPEAVARFEQEGRLAARIRDPHLVAALHFGVSETRRYIVYESLEGVAPVTTLLELGRLDPFLVCDLALQLLGALDALHDAGVAHLDLAPGNCLWRERSSGRVEVFLADLGNLQDLYRVASLVGLAISLIVISLAYRRFVFPSSDTDAQEGGQP